MKILYIDTSSSYLYTGIVEDNRLLIEIKEKLDKELSIFTLPKIAEMLEKVNLKPNDIDKIIVVNGPGSFTGIRIGITIAKTYAWTLHKPIIMLSSLEAMALSVKTDGYIVPIINARRGYVYGSIYDAHYQNIIKDQYIYYEKLLEQLKLLTGSIVIVSNDDMDMFSLNRVKYDPDILKIVKFVQDRETVNPHAVEPAYLKLTEAEEKNHDS